MSTVLKVADVVTKFLRGSLYQLKVQGCLLKFFEVVICSPEIKVLLAEEKKMMEGNSLKPLFMDI